MKKTYLGTAIAVALLAPIAPAAAADTVTVREGDLIEVLSGTRANGSVEFLEDGLRVVTTDTSSDAKAAEYWAPTSTELPDAVSLDWTGTEPQPGSQIVFDLDADRANDNTYNILVGEPVYGDDYWYTGGQARAAQRGFTCPQTGGGFGSDCHGTLEEWQATLPDAEVYAYGFSLGSGIKGQGLIRSLTADDTTYTFTGKAEALSVSPTTYSAKNKVNRKAILRFGTEARGDNEVLAGKVRWLVKVDGKRAFAARHGFDANSRFVEKFAKHTGKHVVELLVAQNGEEQERAETVVVRTGR
ncbi:hypothetical protein [Nocardioides sp. GXQ0305]|uniref:hypothetical protein n=1 Tax=Nocardioides sp. GXQ0305 TaxID=3423912 RepID=UPI003D7E6AFB